MEEFVKKRTNAKRAITKIETYVNTKIREQAIEREQFRLREEHLLKSFQMYDVVQCELENIDEAHAADRDAIEEQYFTLLARIRVYTEVPATSNNLSNRTTENNNRNVKLPNIRTPTFAGKYEEWNGFISLFKALIDDKDMKDVQKFVYLKLSLTGEPLNLVKELELTDDNYKIAMDLLKKRYENNLATINSHLKELVAINSLTKDEVTSLREFCANIRQHVNALKSLKLPVEKWDVLLVYLLSQKLDFQTRKAYELEKDVTELPTLEEFLKFLEKRCTALESISKVDLIQKTRSKVTHVANNNFSSKSNRCIFCNLEHHSIYKCTQFSALSDNQKRKFVGDKKLCYNCLSMNHGVKQCKARGCSICNRKHHTLLHTNSGPESRVDRSTEGTSLAENADEKIEEKASLVSNSTKSQILLATAKVWLTCETGIKIQARALLDSGSQISFITTEVAQKLNLKINRKTATIGGIGDINTRTKGFASLSVESLMNNSCKLRASFAILDNITGDLPQTNIAREKLILPPNIELADPNYDRPAKLDLLIGADLYFELISPGLIKLGPNLPTLQNSQLGWLLAGNAPTNSRSFFSTALICSSSISLEESMSRFCQLEEIADVKALSGEEKKCEKIFQESVKRLSNGRFQVDLPLKEHEAHKKLGNSFLLAKRRFVGLEKRLLNNKELFKEYKSFIDEYIDLGHGKYVELDEELEKNQVNKCFLPHHCVIRNESKSTKLRVVFDASMKTESGISLNEISLKGYTVQPELFDILCRFRTFNYVLTADIKKMYRMIKVNKEQLFLQNILWRENSSQRLKCIELQTVTYGTKPAAFLATRVLKKLAEDNSENYPLASKAILHQCYMDDFLCGSDSLEEVIKMKVELIALLESAGFKLHKWGSNEIACLNDSKVENSHEKVIEMEDDISSKVLGISWSAARDVFKICFAFSNDTSKLTKRFVFSQIAKIFDPLGLVSPIVVVAKIIMQKVWISKIDWDEIVPVEVAQKWKAFVLDIASLQEVQVPRSLFEKTEIKEIQLHGFSDASMMAYGCCIYLRVLYCNKKISSNLICSKSRVAPLKSITLPRLELCGALLLARVVAKLKSIFSIDFSCTTLWTDSQIVLCWLAASSSKWQTFVSNRVGEIQDLSAGCSWQHVSSNDNPADLVSRGTTTKKKIDSALWWHGPEFLYQEKWEIPVSHEKQETIVEIPEEKRATFSSVEFKSFVDWDRFSNFSRLQRSMAYVLRFIENVQKKTNKYVGTLLVCELKKALRVIIFLIQREAYGAEIAALRAKGQISNTSSLRSLNVFIDKEGILRINGRLSEADISYNQKFPIVMPAKHHIVRLLIKLEHKKLLHAGAQTTLYHLRLNYWVINGLREVKNVIKNCITCHRLKAQASQQLMGSLPADRVNVACAFLKVGVDFGGPIMVKNARIRGSVNTKAYISLFVCMVTKAIHLELVSSLSTENFLLTLKRFIARRGKPQVIYSDNATNFKGGNNYLRDVFEFFESQQTKETINNFLSEASIEWKFIPPNSPHWGGLWEAGIKSTKYYLNKIMGNANLTFEEVTTVLAQIEAILNSRPLCPISTDPSDLACLTPGHFSINRPLMAPPEYDLSERAENRLSYWEKCTKLQQNFWKRWSKDYLNLLQNRPKWLKEKNNLKVNDLVLVKDDNVAPLKWSLARVIEIYPGNDSKVRVVKIRTKDGVYTRSITKLCPLPCNKDD